MIARQYRLDIVTKKGEEALFRTMDKYPEDYSKWSKYCIVLAAVYSGCCEPNGRIISEFLEMKCSHILSYCRKHGLIGRVKYE